jgi:hypothetical protein
MQNQVSTRSTPYKRREFGANRRTARIRISKGVLDGQSEAFRKGVSEGTAVGLEWLSSGKALADLLEAAVELAAVEQRTEQGQREAGFGEGLVEVLLSGRGKAE